MKLTLTNPRPPTTTAFHNVCLGELKISVIRDKPVDILNYLVEEFFSERSQINIKEKIAEHETIANKLRHGGEVD